MKNVYIHIGKCNIVVDTLYNQLGCLRSKEEYVFI